MAENAANVRGELLEGGTLLHVAWERPIGNVLTSSMLAAIGEQLSAAAANRALRLVVLQGANGDFSFGASVEEHRREHAPAMLRLLSTLVRQIALHPVPIAALVEGRCLGGAFELALACHFVFATPETQLGCPEIRLAVFPPVLAALGPWRLGGALSDRLLLTGETITGVEAHVAGLVTRVVARERPLADLLDWYRATMRRVSPSALREATAARSAGAGVAELVGPRLERLEQLYVERVLPSHDGNEGIEAFIARRPPRWEVP